MGATARTARRLPRWLAGIAWILAVAAASGSGGEDELEDDVFTGVVLELDEEEGVAYARALRPEGEDGWMELWQEGHRLMANTTELVQPAALCRTSGTVCRPTRPHPPGGKRADGGRSPQQPIGGSAVSAVTRAPAPPQELSIGVRGVDTYLWASLYDGAGRWIAQSNVLHTGHHPVSHTRPLPALCNAPLTRRRAPRAQGVEVRISPDFSARRWEEGAPLEVPFELALVPGADAAAADTAIVLIDNQTTVAPPAAAPAQPFLLPPSLLRAPSDAAARAPAQGMLQLHAALERGAAPAAFRYAHSGQVEVGRHTLSLAVLAPGAATPAAFSAQVTFQVDPAPLDVQSYTAGWPWGAAASPPDPAPRACAPALRACFARAARRVPPNRQYTELEDAADACASQHCAGAAPGGAALAAAARAPLLALLDEAGSALAAGRPAGEALLRAGQALAALRAPALAARAYRAALRVVGRADAPLPRRQCTYPGCNEMGKDACNLLQRAEIEAEAGAAEAGAEAEGAVYARHLRHLLPAADAGAAAGGGAAAAPDGGRYSVGDVVFGCLTTVSSYGTRAAAVRDTWRRRATHFHFYGDAPDAALPVTPFGALAGGTLGREGAFLQAQVARADYASSLAKFFLALLDMHACAPASLPAPAPAPARGPAPAARAGMRS